MFSQLPSFLIVMALDSEGAAEFMHASIPVLYTGVGKINAAYCLTRKLSEYASEKHALPLVINFGTAGSRSLPGGSVLACDEFVQRDMDATSLGFELGETPYDGVPARLCFPRVFKHLPHGVCGTGDSFSTGYESRLYDVVDMEGFALAKVCRLFDANFASVNYVSDGADEDASKSWNENISKAGTIFAKLFLELKEAVQSDGFTACRDHGKS